MKKPMDDDVVWTRNLTCGTGYRPPCAKVALDCVEEARAVCAPGREHPGALLCLAVARARAILVVNENRGSELTHPRRDGDQCLLRPALLQRWDRILQGGDEQARLQAHSCTTRCFSTTMGRRSLRRRFRARRRQAPSHRMTVAHTTSPSSSSSMATSAASSSVALSATARPQSGHAPTVRGRPISLSRSVRRVQTTRASSRTTIASRSIGSGRTGIRRARAYLRLCGVH